MPSTRPVRRQILSGQKEWDADIEANLRQDRDIALVLPEHVNAGALPDPTKYRGCLATIGDASGTTKLVLSDGTDWLEVTLGSPV